MKKQNPVLRVWELGASQHGRLISSVSSALLGVVLGMIPYFAAIQIIAALFAGNNEIIIYLQWLVIGFLGYAARTILYNMALSISHKATFSILKSIRQEILAKLPKLSLGTVMDMPSGKMKQMIVDQVDGMETTLAHLFPELTANIAGAVLIIAYLFVLDWRMALVSIISIPVGMAFMMTVMGNYSKDYEGSVKVTKDMNETIVEYIGGIEVIKAFNQGKSSYAKLADRIRANAQYYYQWMKKCQIGISISNSIVPACLITVLPIGFMFYRNGSLSEVNFIAVIILSLGIAGPLLAAMNFVDTLAMIGTTVDSIDEILHAKEQQHLEQSVTESGKDITVSHVSFGYHEEQEILHDISFHIEANSMTALVGPSGSGKSTIAKLIAGFWDVKKGEILFGKTDVKKISLARLYEQVAFVTQENFLFDDTIRENIRMGKTTATDAEIEAVCRAAGCDTFIKNLENGYETKVGSGGTHLSGGERQRISIARAMLKDAPIVILDEATAYIDPENEAMIQRAIAKLVQGKTVIVVAHRLSTIKDADKIIVIKDGKMEAEGKHEVLLKDCPLYQDMWQAHIGTKEGSVA